MSFICHLISEKMIFFFNVGIFANNTLLTGLTEIIKKCTNYFTMHTNRTGAAKVHTKLFENETQQLQKQDTL